MEREKLYRTLFKFNENNEQTFCEFKQLTPVGKRIVYIVINLALGETKIKSTIQAFKHLFLAKYKKIQF